MPRHWSYHYIISCGLSLFTLVVFVVVFKGKRQEVLLAESGVDDPTLIGVRDGEAGDQEGTKPADSSYKAMFSQAILHFLATFILLYVGVELTVGGTSYVLIAVTMLIEAFRLAHHLYYSRARRRPKLGVHHNRLLRRPGTWSCRSASPQRAGKFYPRPYIDEADSA